MQQNINSKYALKILVAKYMDKILLDRSSHCSMKLMALSKNRVKLIYYLFINWLSLLRPASWFKMHVSGLDGRGP